MVPKFREIEAGYLHRWYLVPRNRMCNIMLHKFIGNDPRYEFHDHPWWFVSICLKGELWEFTEDAKGWESIKVVPRWIPRFFPAVHRHRFELPEHKKPAWTLVVTGRWMRSWGMYRKGKMVELMSFKSD